MHRIESLKAPSSLRRGAVSLLIVLLITLTTTVGAHPSDDHEKEMRRVENIRVQIRKLGIGEDARIDLQLRDGRKLKGYIVESSADSLRVHDGATNSVVDVQYPSVKKAKGQNLSTGAKIAIIAGVIAGVVILAIFAAGK